MPSGRPTPNRSDAASGLTAGRPGLDATQARLAGLVRQARRSGRLVIGVALTRAAVREGHAAAVLIAEDLNSTRRDALIERWRVAGVPLYRGWTKDALGELAGRNAVAVLPVTDRHVAAGMAALVKPGPDVRNAGVDSTQGERKRGENSNL
ncbi:MAG: L7Ae/L30e/S12e/Gadd45 family ribosomal protein [Gemmatimonadota bacterium]